MAKGIDSQRKTWADHGRAVLVAVSEVLRHPAYLVLAAVIGLAALLFSIWVQNLALISTVLKTAGLAPTAKLLLGLLGGIRTNFSLFSASYTVLIALLFGLNIAMILYYLRRRRGKLPGGGMTASVGGIASGVVGVSCAACGSFLLSTVLSFLGASSALTLLPWKGEELGLISVALLAFSIYLIADKIAAPAVCGLNSRG